MIVDNREKIDYVRHNFTPIKNKLLNKRSKAESHFQKLLIDSGLYFVREKCNFKYNTRWCYYDFYLPFYRLYIEIDGESHNNETQKAIDMDKERLVKNKHKFIIRYTNEEVLVMDSICLDDLISKVALTLKTKRHPNRDYKSKYLQRLEHNFKQSREDMLSDAKYEIDESREVFMYDNFSGNYFKFENVLYAKLNIQLSINEILNLLYDFEYKKSSNRRFVFGWTLEECEMNVAKVYY